MILRTAIIALSLITINAYSQGLIDGFFQGKSEGVVALSASYENASKYWAGEKEIDFERNMPHAGLFASYGILNGLDAVASVPFVNLNPQDASLFLKGRLLPLKARKQKHRFTLRVAARFSTPITNYYTESSNAIGQRASVLEGRMFMQYHFRNKVFIQVQGGYGAVAEPVPSYIPASIKLGYTADTWYADLWFDYRDAEDGKDYLGVLGRRPNNFRELEVDYQRVGGSFYKPLSDVLGISLGASYTLSGRNTFQSAIVSVSVVRKL